MAMARSTGIGGATSRNQRYSVYTYTWYVDWVGLCWIAGRGVASTDISTELAKGRSPLPCPPFYVWARLTKELVALAFIAIRLPE